MENGHTKKGNVWWNNEMVYAVTEKKSAYLEMLNGNVKRDEYKKCKTAKIMKES